jgi:predicted metal-dependent phosphoesterase TrpH
MLVDLHCHTLEKSYDGKVPALMVVRTLLEHGFDGVVFTDHNTPWQPEELAALRREANLPGEFFLGSGQEVRTALGDLIAGDLLVYGPLESIPDGTQITEVLELARRCGGHCIAAHAGAQMVGLGSRVGDFPLLAVETWNGRYGARVAKESQRLARQFGLMETGGSDAHQDKELGGGGTLLPTMAYDWEEIARQIAAGEARPWRPGWLGSLERWWG